MSFIERIREIEEKKARKASQEAELKLTEQKRIEAIRVETEKADRLEWKIRRDFIIEQTNRIITLSGILENLQKIDKEIHSQNSKDHYFLFAPALSKALLVWGHGFTVSHSLELKAEGNIHSFNIDNSKVFSKPMLNDNNVPMDCDGRYDFHFISISINPDTETLSINRKEFEPKDWKNKEILENALFDSYLQPEGEYYIRPRMDDIKEDYGDRTGTN